MGFVLFDFHAAFGGEAAWIYISDSQLATQASDV